MKKIKKILLVLVVIVVVVAIAAVVVVGVFLDKIVKKGIETVGPGITQTTVTVDTVGISIFSGSAVVNDLIIGSPEGYSATNAISVGKASIAIVPGSIFGDKVIIHSVAVRDPQITFEGNPLGANNLKKLMDNVDASAGASQQTAATTPKPKGAARKLEVDDFLITNAEVHVHLTGLVNRDMTLPIPTIHLTDLGQGPEGITAAELTKEVLQQVTTKTLEAVASQVGNLGKGAENLGQDALHGASKTVGDNVNKVGKSLGGLFGK